MCVYTYNISVEYILNKWSWYATYKIRYNWVVWCERVEHGPEETKDKNKAMAND